MKCTECGKDFTPECDEEEICPKCQVEGVPEAQMDVGAGEKGREKMSVRGFLVTGPDKNLMAFHFHVCMVLNGVDRRGQTVHYTCGGEDADYALEAAREADVSVQEIIGAADKETYQTLHTGSHGMLWQPKKKGGDKCFT